MEINQNEITGELTVVFLGHVDHGKSTLIGRLLYDTKQVTSDKIEFATARSQEQGRLLEFAYLLDGLEEEQEQGITIDFTQTRFATAKRQFILADAPGHREFLKNMMCGASRADAAILLIDATEGVQEQSRRHGYLLTLLGIKQLAVVVNKMDLVGWEQNVFQKIKADYEEFLASIGFSAQAYIPAAAFTGDNVAVKSRQLLWYPGKTVLEQLEAFRIKENTGIPLRIPVQDVYRFGQRRLLAGRLEGGLIALGDEIILWPTHEVTTVKAIERWPEANVHQAIQGENVALELSDPLFAERGMIIAKSEHPPLVSRSFTARIFWLGRQPLVPQQRYKLKIGFQETGVWIEQLTKVLDIGKLCEVATDTLPAGFVSEAILTSDQPLVFDTFHDNAELGRFVLIEEYQIVGGGIITAALTNKQTGEFRHDRGTDNLFPTAGFVTKTERRRCNGHTSQVFWLTGLSGSGKTTLARKVEEQLFHKKYQVYVLDGDNVRSGLNGDLGFSSSDRKENIRRIAEVAKLFVDAGIIVLVALISPYAADRDLARSRFEDGEFTEVYVKCPLEICEARDSKGLYKKARNHQLQKFTGISDMYEPPTKAEIVVETDKMPVEMCVKLLLQHL